MASRRPLFRAAALNLLTTTLLAACGGADLDEKANPSAQAGGSADIPADSGTTGATGNTTQGGTAPNASNPDNGGSNGGGGDGNSSSGESPPAPAPQTAYATEMLAAVNANRSAGANCGGQVYPPTASLSWDSSLEQAALGHSEYLRDTNTFSHSGAGNSTIGTRVSATGYEWSAVGENIAAGYPSITSVVQGWMNSPGHCRNIMSPGFAQLGVAVVNGDTSNSFSTYWTMVLAQPR